MNARQLAVTGAAIALAAAAAGSWWWSSQQPLARAEAAVRNTLTDPASAQFRQLASVRDGVVCGEVNAKNAMGGYVGFRRFVAFPDGVLQVQPAPSAEGYLHVEFGALEGDYCRN